MLYIRISLMIPAHGHEREAIDLLDQVANHCNGQPGYLGAYVLQPHERSGMIGRVTLWEDEESAGIVAQSARMLSLRSELDRVIGENTHLEFGFMAERGPVHEGALNLRSADALAAVADLLRDTRGAEPPPTDG